MEVIVKRPTDFSFPSGHTIASFEFAVAILLRRPKIGIAALVLAVLISFSRLYLYLHYPTDVFTSVILGSLFGFLGVKIADYIYVKLNVLE